MKYQLELELNSSRKNVVEKFLDSKNLSKWQPSLVNFEHISGEPREVGAKSRQIHKMGKRQTEMIETITEKNYPERFSASYEADSVWNLVSNQFTENGPEKTKWILDSEFKCRGFIRIIAFFFPGMFKKQTETYMHYFKDFVEK